MKRVNIRVLFLIVCLLAAGRLAAQPNTTFVNPPNPGTCITVQVAFDWDYTGPNTVADSGYTLQVARDMAFTDLVIDIDGLVSSSFTLDYGLTFETTYYWRTITEFTPSGTETSETATFTTGDAPPRYVSPADISYCMDLNNIDFKWENIHADDYQIDIATSNTFGASSLPGYPVNTAAYTHTFATGPLDKNTVYYWRVRANLLAKCGWTEWKDTFSFRTTSDAPTLAGPADASTCVYVDADFWWDQHPGAKSYNLEFATDPAFGSEDMVYSKLNQTSNTFTMPAGELEGYTTYYWRVRAIYTEQCVTDWSSTWYFKTGQTAPILLNPTSNQGGIELQPVFYWETDTFPAPDPTFDMQVSANVNFSSMIYNETGIPATGYSTSFTLDDTQFEYNKYYFVRVRAVYGAPDNCTTDWSEINRFKTVYPVTQLQSPMSSTECIDLKYDFKWHPVTGATKYRLQISENPDMSAPEINLSNIGALTRNVTLKKPFTHYYWRVRAEDATTTGLWSEKWDFTTNASVPTAVYPKDDSVNLPIETPIVWTSIYDEALYDIQVSKNSDMSSPFVDQKGYNSTTFSVTLPDYYQTYYWKVRGYAETCTTAWSPVYSFSTGLPKPTLISPRNNSTRQPLVPVFSWSKVPGTGVKYEIMVSDDNLFNNVVYSRKQIPSTSTSIDIELAPEKGYYWKIKASNEVGESPWSNYFKFTTGIAGPAQPLLAEPLNQATEVPVTPTLKWHPAVGATQYLLQVAKDVDFSVIVEDMDETANIADTVYEITSLEYYTTYYWRVAAMNDGGTSKWSDSRLFITVNNPPDMAPTMNSPLDGTIDVLPPVAFTWDPVENSTKYQLQITQNSTTFTDEDNIVDEIINAPTTNYSWPDVEYNTTYYWRVRALNNAGPGPWAPAWSFTTSVNSVDEQESVYNLTIMPNPASDKACFGFYLPLPAKVTVRVFDILGREIGTVVDGNLQEGSHNYVWDCSQLRPGVCYCRITLGNYTSLRQMVITR